MANDLNLSQVTERQASPEVTINDATLQLGNALADDYSIDLSAGNQSLTSAQYRGAIRFLATGVATGGRTVTLPLVKRTVILACAVANTNTISLIRGATTLTLAPGGVYLVHTDGTANGLDATAVGDLSGGAPYDIGVFVPGGMSNNQIVLRYTFDRQVTFAANMAGSKFANGTNATATTVITLKKNGALIGATSTASISTVGVVTFVVSAVTFDAGDLLSLHGQAVADATIADINFTFKGSRT